MAWYKCKTCGHEYHSGFFSPQWSRCPKCWSKFSQISGIIKTIIKIAIPLVVIIPIIRCASPSTYAKVFSHTAAALDSTTLYAYSKDAYLESVIRGRQEYQYYLIAGEVPYYSSILSRAKLNTVEPLGMLPAKTVVELGTAIRRGADVWIPVSFYIKDKPQQAFALFPRDWEEMVSVYEWEKEVMKIREAYQTFVKKNFELMEVKPKDEKDYKEKYNDYYKVRDVGDTTYFYAPKTDKSRIDAAYTYYLNRESVNMVLLQSDSTWKRPALGQNKTEEAE
jgi:hypothetical protein